MRGEKTLKILGAITGGAMELGCVMDILLTGGYNISVSGMERELDQRRKEISKEKIAKQQRQKFYCMINKLKNDGLLTTQKHNKKSSISLTARGEKILAKLRKQISTHQSLPHPSSYQKTNDNKFTIVVFDIPESERKKRDWLRMVLKQIGLQLIQKSVWMGKIKIPEKLLENFKELKLIDYIEIFEISKTGTLRQIT